MVASLQWVPSGSSSSDGEHFFHPAAARAHEHRVLLPPTTWCQHLAELGTLSGDMEDLLALGDLLDAQPGLAACT